MDQKQPPPYPLRMPDELRQTLEARAKKNGRSLNAEIVVRLNNDVFIEDAMARDAPFLKPRSLLEQVTPSTRVEVGELVENALKPIVEQITQALIKDYGEKHPESKVPASPKTRSESERAEESAEPPGASPRRRYLVGNLGSDRGSLHEKVIARAEPELPERPTVKGPARSPNARRSKG